METMIYTFKCLCGVSVELTAPISDGPPQIVRCSRCLSVMDRDWQADAPMIDTSGCRDHDDIPAQQRVASTWDRSSPEATEHEFQEHIQKRRAEIRDAGGQRGSIKQTHSVPAHIYHGKIKETGDKRYWDDSKNLSKHKSCKVE